MKAQPKFLNDMEREAVYRMRERFAQGREASFGASAAEQEYICRLAEDALYPEKPLLSFSGEEQDEDTEFFALASKFGGKRNVRKLITCGGVDDGKSTLIGRVLYDTKSEQEKEAIRQDAAYLRPDGSIDYALLAGVTREEASQGITVRASYSMFGWGAYGFLMADVPGHEEYTRNMAYAAANADIAILMVAANKGIVAQTRRHTRICYFMGIRNMIFAVNKMDMVSFDQNVFLQLAKETEQMMEEYADCIFQIVPVAAKGGENIAAKSGRMDWYQGGTLLETLWRTQVKKETSDIFCMPVQRICKSSQMKGAVVKKRIIQGEILQGNLKAGDEIVVCPTGRKAHVSAIYCMDSLTESAALGDPVGIELDRELDIARGYLLTKEDFLDSTDRLEANILWVSDNRLTQGKRYRAKIATLDGAAVVTKIGYQIDVNTGEHRYAESLTGNEMARCEICFKRQMYAAREKDSRRLGTVLLYDRETGALAAYGNIIHTISDEAWKKDGSRVTSAERESALGQKAGLVLFPGGEKTKEHMNYAERYLLRMGFHTIQAKQPKATRSFLDAGLIVLLCLQPQSEQEIKCMLEPERIFDCGKIRNLDENFGNVLKQMKQWASELI